MSIGRLPDEQPEIVIYGQINYLWMAVDQGDDVIDILVRRRRDAEAAKRFFNKALIRARRHTTSTCHIQAEQLSASGERVLTLR